MKKFFTLFLILVATYLLLSYFGEILLDTNELIINSLSDELTREQISNIIENRSKWKWVGHLITPIFLLIKILLIAYLIDIGLFFYDFELDYREILKFVTISEFIFIIATLIKLGWFLNFANEYSLEDIKKFYPLSVLNIIGYDGLNSWYIYPLQVLNLFELAYLFTLSHFLSKKLKIIYDKGLSIIISSYGIGLLIWVIGVMFLTLNMS
jgi:hypothetical protein